MRRLLCWLGFHRAGEVMPVRRIWVRTADRWEAVGLPFNRITLCERCGVPVRMWTVDE